MPLLRKANVTESDAAPARSLAELVNDLSSADPETRRAAAADLGNIEDGHEALAARMLVETQRAVREAIGTALLRIGHPATAGNLAALLWADDAAARNQGRELLMTLPGSEAVARALVRHSDPDVRMFALEVLAQKLGEGAPSAILAAALDDDDVNVVAHAIELVAARGTLDSCDALERLRVKFADESFIEFVIDSTLAAINDRRTTR